MSEKKLLTIAIPTYQRENELKETLTSIITQFNDLDDHYKRIIDVIVVDNNSTSFDIYTSLKEFESRIPLTIYKNDKNIGIDGNVNQCILKANTKFIWLFSDDDLLEDNAINIILQTISTMDNTALFVINYNSYDSKVKVLLKDKCIEEKEDDLSIISNLSFVSSTLINNDILKKIGLSKFDKYIGSLYYHLAVAYDLADVSYKFIELPLIKFRSNRSNLGGGRVKVALDPYLIFLERNTKNLTYSKESFFQNNVLLWLKHHKKTSSYNLSDLNEIRKTFGTFSKQTLFSLIIFCISKDILDKIYRSVKR